MGREWTRIYAIGCSGEDSYRGSLRGVKRAWGWISGEGYERTLARELTLRGLNVRSQASFPVGYKGQCVGDYVADLLIEDKLIVELKCVDQFANEHLAQCINYLKASGMKLALLINFQKPRVDWKRIVYSS